MTQPVDSALDFERIVFGFDRETAVIEYKSGIGWNEMDRRSQVGLIKDLMAFGNSDTFGYLVVGVSETDSSVYERTGVSEEQAASYDPTPIGEVVRTYSDPEVQFTIHVPELQGRRFVVFRVAPFATVPHICRQSYDNVLEQAAIYVRTDNAQSIKVPTTQHMRRLVERATFNQRGSLLAQIRELVGPGAGATQPPSLTQGFRDQISRRFGR
ncbi:MAG TPA: ATP-binding protein [Dehalococcoidia bacterium]|nr:ATP-binding protein [Dehalococcoidia bacterium]